MVGLLTHNEVRRMIDREPEVRDTIRKWFHGKREALSITVAGPPTEEDRKKYQGLAQIVPLPTVVLGLTRVKHNLSGEWGVLVKVTDKDITEIKRWNRDWIRKRN